MKIKFTEVGRDKKSWSEDIPCVNGLLSAKAMVKSIKKHRALASNGIEFLEDGTIVVGGFREVGRWAFDESI